MPQLDRSHYPRNSRVTEHECLYCQVKFYSNKPKTKFCSSKCRVYHHIYVKKATNPAEISEREQEVKTDFQPQPIKPTLVLDSKETAPGTKTKKAVKRKEDEKAKVNAAGQMSLF